MVPKATAALGDWTLGAMSHSRGRCYCYASSNQAAAARTCNDCLSRANGSGQEVHAICVSETSADLGGPVPTATASWLYCRNRHEQAEAFCIAGLNCL